MSKDSVCTSCIADWTDCRIDGLAVRHLTLPAAAAGHPFRRMCELKFAAHVGTARTTKIGHDSAGVVRHEARSGIPVVKAAQTPARAPAGPQRPEVIDLRILGDLEELPAVCLAAGERCAHR